MFHTETRQALRALTVLAERDELVPLAQLATLTGAPAPTLARVLARLARRGLVTGRRGPHGGYRLARPAAGIALRDVVLPIEGPRFARGCLFGRQRCSPRRPCPLHGAWEDIRDRVGALLAGRTVADLAAGERTAPASGLREIP
jgi:Rrf2 family protein